MNKFDLYDKFLRGELDDSETDQLMEILEDEEFGKEFVEYSLETKLFVECGRKVRSKDTAGKIEKFKNKKQRKSFLPLLAIAAALVIGFFSLFYFNQKNKIKLVSGSNVKVIRNGSEIGSENVFKEGDILRTSEVSEITFEDGTLLKTEKNTEIKIQELVLNKIISIKEGRVSVRAVHQEFGFIKIITNDAVTEVVGTEFTVDKTLKGTVVSVEKGKVKFSNDKGVMNLTKGMVAFADSKNGIISLNEPVKSKWELWKELLKKDEELLFYVGFEQGKYSGSLLQGQVISDSEGNYFLNNGRILYENTEGLKVGKKITMFAWLRCLGGGGHCPVLTKGDQSWRMQINIDKPHIGYGGNKKTNYHDAHVTLEHKQWYLLHQVITEKYTKMYLNGQLISETPIRDPELNDNTKAIMVGGNSEKESFFFPGDIGEAGLINREMTPAEISEMFEYGKFRNQVENN